MNMIQHAATMALLTLIIYYAMVIYVPSGSLAPAQAQFSPYNGPVTDYPSDLNLTGSSVYDEDAKGILPVNHDPFETSPDFESNITDINRFYQNNPDIFNKSNAGAYVPDVTNWNTQGQELYNNLAQSVYTGPVHGYNYEDPAFA